MGHSIIEKILLDHSTGTDLHPGDIIEVSIDARVARDFGGASVVRNIEEHNLEIDDPSSTFFTFDCNPGGSDQDYAANQQKCRIFARERGIKVYDVNRGVGTHVLIEEGLACPGTTAVSTDSHANILGAVGAFGQGMGDKDIAAAWSRGKVWFRVPPSILLDFRGAFPAGLTAKDIVLNLLRRFGPAALLGTAVELRGEAIDRLTLDDRITIASMATEMGALTMLFTPNDDVLTFCEGRCCRRIRTVCADPDAGYEAVHELDASTFTAMVSRPGKPHDAVPIEEVRGTKIDSAFIGSCTNGRIQDMKEAAAVLKDRKLAPEVVLKIVPSTDRVWNECLERGLMDIFKKARALVSNPGCAGCASGQVGQNGPGEVTVSTGNRNFPGKQGRGAVYLASPAVVAASAVAGYITDPDHIPEQSHVFNNIRLKPENEKNGKAGTRNNDRSDRPVTLTGKAWLVPGDNIDTDMIFHNRFLSLTDPSDMGKHAFSNLPGFEDFPLKANKGDILVTGRNFGAGSSRQQAVDCFLTLGIACIIAPSFAAIYERNAVNAALPLLATDELEELEVETGDVLEVGLDTGKIVNRTKNRSLRTNPLSEIQMEIYRSGGLFQTITT